jgi:sucrose-6-phosphate hydrolase SacC (GH32 family)
MEFYVEKTYLWLPVSRKGKKEILSIYYEEEKIHELEIQIGNTADFYVFIYMGAYKGKKIKVNGGNDFFNRLLCFRDNKPEYKEERRPRLHFTPEAGWMNDPNGLIYKDGWWHMFFQHNPYGTEWGNMHWGHAKSRDLISWEQEEEAVYPDEYGTAFSGCAVEDKDGVAGYGKGSVLFYYTAATDTSVWNGGKEYAQRMLYSMDGGNTLIKTEAGGVPFLEGSNRDPKIFYYEPTKRYFMVLYLDKNDFMILESENLLDWKTLQRITLENAWECPDFLNLPVENEKGKTKWLFWSADGFYYLGDFDGKQFTTDGKCRKAYGNKLPYAAQSYAGVKGRCISQSWLRVPNRGSVYTGMMALPVELCLQKEEEDYYICLRPVKEISGRRKNGKEITVNGKGFSIFPEETGPRELLLTMPWQETGSIEFVIYGKKISVDFGARELIVETERTSILKKESFTLQMFIDFEAVEIFAQEGRVYFPCAWDLENLQGEIVVCNETVGLAKTVLYEL